MFKYFMCVVTLLIVLMSTGCTSGRPAVDMARSHYKMAQSHVAMQDYSNALREMLQAVKIKPKDPDYQMTLATIYFEKKAYLLSEQHYKKSLQLRPDDPTTQNNLAALYLNMQRWDDAARLFRKVADNLLFRHQTRALIGLGVANYRGEHHQRAVLAFNEVLQLAPGNTTALSWLGNTYYTMGKFQLARQRLEEALQIVPNNNNVRLLLGQTYMQLDKSEAAAEAFREVANRADGTAQGVKAREYLQLLN
ncbi:MAG: tetratricopeptide repeat protein [Thermodesulfobacteriota bacterium]|nr:tetratricopeptide repeat protein [Thermodesulfobacteriota bacterium]